MTSKKTLTIIVNFLLITSTTLCFIVVIKTVVFNDPSLLGYKFYYIVTGSMEPTIPTNSLTLVNTKEKDYEVGDIITFYFSDSPVDGVPNTHRIISIVEEDGYSGYVTQGDANPTADMEVVTQENIVGEVVWYVGSASTIGILVEFVGTQGGFLFLILLPILWITIGAMRSFIREYKNLIREEVHLSEVEDYQEEVNKMVEEILREKEMQEEKGGE